MNSPLVAGIFFTTTLAWAGSPAVVTDRAELRGFTAADQTLRQRILKPGDKEPLLEEIWGRDGEGLEALLGSYQPSGLGTAYRNGVPNPVNALLWFLTLDAVVRELSGACAGNSPLKPRLDPNFAKALSGICGTEAPTLEALYAYWDALIGPDAPMEEFLAWQTFAGALSKENLPPPTRAQTLTLSILMGPDFLLSP